MPKTGNRNKYALIFDFVKHITVQNSLNEENVLDFDFSPKFWNPLTDLLLYSRLVYINIKFKIEYIL